MKVDLRTRRGLYPIMWT
ncbi:hypothetical protein STRTUCAR8_02097, partial [Streptomyces turgidiscabies Car8]